MPKCSFILYFSIVHNYPILFLHNVSFCLLSPVYCIIKYKSKSSFCKALKIIQGVSEMLVQNPRDDSTVQSNEQSMYEHVRTIKYLVFFKSFVHGLCYWPCFLTLGNPFTVISTFNKPGVVDIYLQTHRKKFIRAHIPYYRNLIIIHTNL